MPVSNQRRATLAAAVIVGMLVASMSAYTVKPGDTLSEIAADHGVSTTDLAAANSLLDPNRIYRGPVVEHPRPVRGHEFSHRHPRRSAW